MSKCFYVSHLFVSSYLAAMGMSVMRQSGDSFLCALENTEVTRTITSVLFCTTRQSVLPSQWNAANDPVFSVFVTRFYHTFEWVWITEVNISRCIIHDGYRVTILVSNESWKSLLSKQTHTPQYLSLPFMCSMEIHRFFNSIGCGEL